MKPLQEYLDEVYPIAITQDAHGIYNATIQKIPGCIAQGTTAGAAKANARNKRAGMLKEFLNAQ